MSRPLLAIYSCHQFNFHHDYIQDWFERLDDGDDNYRPGAVRDTWLKDVDIDYRFFYGRSPDPAAIPAIDEVFLNCPDGYYDSAKKTQAMVQWALNAGYDRLLKVDDDVFVYWDRMKKASLGLNAGAYVGGGFTTDEAYAFGAAYTLGTKAMNLIATAKTREDMWAEDKWVGTVLANHNIPVIIDPRYYIEQGIDGRSRKYCSQEALENKDYIILHALSPQMMRDHYAYISVQRLAEQQPNTGSNGDSGAE